MLAHIRPFAVAGSAILAGCGGGGGDAPVPPAGFTGFASVPANGSYIMEGRLTSRSLASSGGSTTMGGVNDDDVAASTRVTNQGGDVVALRVSGGTILADLEGTPDSSGGFLTLREVASTVIASDPATYGNEYSAFGIGFTESATGDVFAGTFGAPTAVADLPNAASYSGDSVGMYVDGSGNAYLTNSTVTVGTTDFTSFDVASTGTTRVPLAGGGPAATSNLDFTGTATRSGTDLSGTFSGTGVDGDLTATFFGPAADEIGGTFMGSGASGEYIGAFGGFD